MRSTALPATSPIHQSPAGRRVGPLTVLVVAAALVAAGWFGHGYAITRGWTTGDRAAQHQSYLPVAPPLTAAVTTGVGCAPPGERPTLKVRLFGQPHQPITVTAYYAPGKTGTAGTVRLPAGATDADLGSLPVGTLSADVVLRTAGRPDQHVNADLDCSLNH